MGRHCCCGVAVALLLAVVCGSVAVAAASASPSAAAPRLAHFLQQATGIDDWLVSTRRLFHTFPELLFQEHNTSATIRRFLDEYGIAYQ